MHAPHSLPVREQRVPAARVAIFSPSVCPSAVGFVRLQCRPSAHRHQLGSPPSFVCRGPVLESPGLAGPSCSPGPIVPWSVCPEAGPRDPERRGARRRRVKRPPTSPRGLAADAGAPQAPLWVTGCGSFVCPCLGRGLGNPSGLGGQPRLRPTPCPGFPRQGGTQLALGLRFLFLPFGAGGASPQPPSPRGPRSGLAENSPASPGV